MGWNKVSFKTRKKMYKEIESDTYMYFIHSYFLRETDPQIISAKTDYSESFVSSVEKEQMWGTQFHPEKSGKKGLKLLKNFAEI